MTPEERIAKDVVCPVCGDEKSPGRPCVGLRHGFIHVERLIWENLLLKAGKR
jgi:hypothetical protein